MRLFAPASKGNETPCWSSGSTKPRLHGSGKSADEAVRAFYDQHLDQFTRADGRVVDFAFVRESIRTALRQQAETEAMDELLAELHEAYAGQIQVFPAALEQAFQ